MTPEALTMLAVGGGAAVGGRWANDWIQAKLDGWVERRAKALYGSRYTAPSDIGKAVLKEFQPCLTEMVKIDAAVHARVAAMEKAIVVLTQELRRAQGQAPVAKSTYVPPVASYVPVPPSEPDPVAPVPPMAAEAWSWQTDKDLLAVAGEVKKSLMQFGMTKASAETAITAALDRVGKQGMSHDELFTEAFRKCTS